MNKPKYLALAFIFLAIMVLLVDALDLYTYSELTTDMNLGGLDGVSLYSMAVTWWQMATFQINNLPYEVVLLVFYPLNLFIVAILFEYLTNLLPW